MTKVATARRRLPKPSPMSRRNWKEKNYFFAHAAWVPEMLRGVCLAAVRKDPTKILVLAELATAAENFCCSSRQSYVEGDNDYQHEITVSMVGKLRKYLADAFAGSVSAQVVRANQSIFAIDLPRSLPQVRFAPEYDLRELLGELVQV